MLLSIKKDILFQQTIVNEDHKKRLSELQARCNRAAADKASKPKIAILGAGPAGLIRAILATVNGNQVHVIEKRAANEKGRLNGILLTETTLAILKEYGIYQLLEEKKCFGNTPENLRKHFPLSIAIKDLEAAMKEVLFQLNQNKDIIIYESHLNKIIDNHQRPIDLVLKTNAQKEIILHNIDRVIIAEGAKSATATNMFKGRYVEVLSQVPVIGGIFTTAHQGKSFTYNIADKANGIVLYTPGLCSIGCVPYSNTAKAVQELSEATETKQDKATQQKKALLNELSQDIFSTTDAKSQVAPKVDQNIFANTTTMSSGFTMPFCDRIGSHSLFFLTGDALFQVDPISGRGANNAIQSVNDILPALERFQNSDTVCKEYTEASIKKIKDGLEKLTKQRTVGNIPFNEDQSQFALFQIDHYHLIKKVQDVAGTTISKALFNSTYGKATFQFCAKTIPDYTATIKNRFLYLQYKISAAFSRTWMNLKTTFIR